MFIFLSKILPLLIYPPGLIFLLLAAALLLGGKKKWQRAALWLALLVLLVGGNPWAANALLFPLESRFSPPEPLLTGDVIVVMGGGTEPDDPPRFRIEVNGAADRLLYAAELYHQGAAPTLLLTGGNISWLDGATPAAERMAVFLAGQGIPREHLILEENSRNSYENARNSAEIIRREGFHRVILITSARHMPRAAALFNNQGVEVTPAPVDYLVTEQDGFHPSRLTWSALLQGMLPSEEGLSLTAGALKEYLGLLIYALRGWI